MGSRARRRPNAVHLTPLVDLMSRPYVTDLDFSSIVSSKIRVEKDSKRSSSLARRGERSTRVRLGAASRTVRHRQAAERPHPSRPVHHHRGSGCDRRSRQLRRGRDEACRGQLRRVVQESAGQGRRLGRGARADCAQPVQQAFADQGRGSRAQVQDQGRRTGADGDVRASCGRHGQLTRRAPSR